MSSRSKEEERHWNVMLNGPQGSFSFRDHPSYAQFQGYKLIQEHDSSSWFLSAYSLPSPPPSLSRIYQGQSDEQSSSAPLLGYKETKERSLHEILAPARPRLIVSTTKEDIEDSSRDDPFAGYIDTDNNVILLTYDAATDSVIFHSVYRLPMAQDLPLNDAYQPSLASLVSADPTTWFAADGAGSLVALHISRSRQASDQVRLSTSEVQTWQVGDASGCILPFSIKQLTGTSEDRFELLLQSIKTQTTAEQATADDVKGLGYHARGGSLSDTVKSQIRSSKAMFEVHLVEASLDAASASQEREDLRLLTPKWSVSGDEPLIAAKSQPLSEQSGASDGFRRYILLAEGGFRARPEGSSTLSKETLSTETAASSSGHDQPVNTDLKPESGKIAPPYSWAQTSDTVTVAFCLPSYVEKNHIYAHFSSKGLSVIIRSESLRHEIAEVEQHSAGDPVLLAAKLLTSGRYESRATWGELDPDGSVWTLEKAVGRTGASRGKPIGILTLHLEKKHEGTRWTHVFGPRLEQSDGPKLSGLKGGKIMEMEAAEDDIDDVAETMDPSELINMLEGLEKYTADADSTAGTGRGGLGLGRTSLINGGQRRSTDQHLEQPSLLKDELDEEDVDVGRNLVVSHVLSVTDVSPAGDTSHQVAVGQPRRDQVDQHSLLAVLVPGHSPSTTNELGVVLKRDLDGISFLHPPSQESVEWSSHVTFPALAYVLASKRDAHRVYLHVSSSKRSNNAVLAFESAPQMNEARASASVAGNLFVYYAPETTGAKHGNSRVIRLDGGSEKDDDGGPTGALLSVIKTTLALPSKRTKEDADDPKSEETLVCLCENKILMIRGIL